MKRVTEAEIERAAYEMAKSGWDAAGDWCDFMADIGEVLQDFVDHRTKNEPLDEPVLFVHPVYLVGSSLAAECSRIRLNEKQLPLYLRQGKTEVFVCSNQRCGAVHAKDPQGHCPTCIMPNGLGWSTMRKTVL